MSAAPPPAAAPRWAHPLRSVGTLAIAAIAVTRGVILFAPEVVFDVDPMVSPYPIGGLGPGGSLLLDALLLLACAAALAGSAALGRRIHPGLLLLALVPLPVLALQGATDADDLREGATWCAAVLGAVTLAHTAGHGALRAAVTSILIGAVAVLLVRGAANVTYEHDATVARFEAEREAFLRDKGWAPDSSSALIFERRLRQRQPTGWFVTTNVFGTFAGMAFVVLGALAVAAGRARVPSGWTGLLALAAFAGAVGVAMTGSKGAIAATAGGAVLVAIPLLPGRLGALVRAALARFGPALAVGAVAAALIGVAVRGAVLPEGFAGEKSLLFRWHYTVASARILKAHPLAGVGPGRFQEAYVRHRVPRNPEEVASAHSVAWDWVCGLGVSGAAWIAVLVILLVAVGRRLGGGRGAQEDDAGADPPPSTVAIARALALPVVGLAAAALVELHVLAPTGLLLRVVGIGAFVGLAATLMMAIPALGRRVADAALAAGALVVAVHAQIEMTLVQPGGAAWGLALVGLAAAPGLAERARGGAPPPPRSLVIAVSALLTITSIVMAVGANAALREEAIMVRAARAILPPVGSGPEALTGPARAARRIEAAALLVDAHDALPIDPSPLVIAAEQHERAAALDPENRLASLIRAREIIERALAERATGRALVTAMYVERALYEATDDPASRAAAIAHARRLADSDPNGLAPRRRLADLLWQLDEFEAARVEYARTLEIDEAFVLDALKRLPDAVRREIRERLGGDGGAGE